MVDIEDKSIAQDDINFVLEDVGKEPPRKSYEVVTSLFKNGRAYKNGSKIELDEKTAKNFKRTGDIKDA